MSLLDDDADLGRTVSDRDDTFTGCETLGVASKCTSALVGPILNLSVAVSSDTGCSSVRRSS